ncbi:MAG: hypothetical protein R3B72_15945 [Polyangiaceae bacterium]
MMNRLARASLGAALALALVSLVACGDGLSPEDATAECERLQEDIPSCLADAAVFTECEACYEECGLNCSLESGCGFVCPD